MIGGPVATGALAKCITGLYCTYYLKVLDLGHPIDLLDLDLDLARSSTTTTTTTRSVYQVYGCSTTIIYSLVYQV